MMNGKAGDLKQLFQSFLAKGEFGELIQGSSVAFLINVIGTGIGYLVQIQCARWLGAGEYGVYIFFFTWAQLLSVAALMGFDISALRFIPEYLARMDAGRLHGFINWSRKLVLLLGICFMGCFAGVCYAYLHGNPQLSPALLGALLIPLLAISELQMQSIRGFKLMSEAYSPVMIILPLLILFMCFGLFMLRGVLSSTVLLLMYGGGYVCIILFQSWVISHHIDLRFPKDRILYNPVTWVKVSAVLLINSLFAMLLLRTDILMLGILRSSMDVGIYSAAAKTATILSFPLVGVNAILAPLVPKLFASGDRRSLERSAQFATFVAFWITMFICLLLILFREVIMGAFGVSFLEGQWPLMILLFGQLVNVGTGSVGLLLTLTGNEKESAWIMGGTALINLFLNLILIPNLHMFGAAIASTLSMVVWNLALYQRVVAKMKIKPSIFSATRTFLVYINTRK